MFPTTSTGLLYLNRVFHGKFTVACDAYVSRMEIVEDTTYFNIVSRVTLRQPTKRIYCTLNKCETILSDKKISRSSLLLVIAGN